jgi:two-component system, OmpR family, alkaline phosphatase synthesis response regulator PhoP
VRTVPRVLLVDDDPAIREVLSAYLLRDGHEVLEAADGKVALRLAATSDIVVLDLMLPGLDGWEVFWFLKRDHPLLPVLMLTAKGAEDERILGLEVGADDYVVKPFSPREVAARVKSLLRRSGVREVLSYQGLTITPSSREVTLNGRSVALSKLEFELLLTLAQHPGMVWSRERLLERVWGADFPGIERVVDVRIAALRKKLGDEPEAPRFIETVHGVGYRFREG